MHVGSVSQTGGAVPHCVGQSVAGCSAERDQRAEWVAFRILTLLISAKWFIYQKVKHSEKYASEMGSN